MSSPEIHVHVHFHQGALTEGVTSRRVDGDILSEHNYKQPTPPPNAEQADLFSPYAPIPEREAAEIPEHPVAITPQTAHDQRREIADYSERNKHLVKVDKYLSEANGKEAAAERVKMGKLKKYSEDGLRNNAKNARVEASKELVLGCGHCALDCAIRGKFSKWSRVHEAADVAKTADQESRRAWRRRLVKDADAHCLPGKTKKPAVQKAT